MRSRLSPAPMDSKIASSQDTCALELIQLAQRARQHRHRHSSASGRKSVFRHGIYPLIVIPTLVYLSQEKYVVKPAQVRMARAALNWSLSDLAEASGVHRNTVSNYETGKYAGSPEALNAIRRALEGAGVVFIDENGGGVKLKAKRGKRQ
jgi:DNA-binding XRE family transcriptional regulator